MFLNIQSCIAFPVFLLTLISKQANKVTSVIATVFILFFANIAPVHATDIITGGIATQGSTYNNSSSYTADKVIDGDLNTFNHTLNGSDNNWWQVKLTAKHQIQTIRVRNRQSSTSRLNGAKIYITDSPWSGSTPSASNEVATLTSDADWQEFTLGTPKFGQYIIIKASGTNFLHMTEVEVDGSVPTAPQFSKDNFVLGLKVNSASGSTVGSVQAIDLQDDALVYSIVESVPFAIDINNGTITLTQAVNHNAIQSYNFTVAVNDGSNSASTNVTVKLLNGNGVTLEKWTGVSGSYVSPV